MIEFKEFSFLSWNVRGASNKTAKMHIREVVRKYNPSFLLIIETHCQFNKMNQFWNNLGFIPVHIIEARGQAGGLWVLVQHGISLGLSVLDSNSFSTTFNIKAGSNEWTCTAVYASPTPSMRDPFWQYLCDINNSINCPWLMIGYFNENLLPGDQRGGSFLFNRSDAFARMFDQCGMVDLNTIGGRFTWHRNCKGNRSIAKKLDRAVADLQWHMAFSEALVEVLCRFHSDHSPILLRLGGLPQERGPRPFRFEAAWIMHEKYQQVVEEAWNRTRGRPHEALNRVKEDSIKFNHEVFGNIFRRKRAIEARLKGIQRRLERVDSCNLGKLKLELQHEYNKILFQEELLCQIGEQKHSLLPCANGD